MTKGKVIATGFSLAGAQVVFRKEEKVKKLIDPNQIQLATIAEAYYCPNCQTVIAKYKKKNSIFD